MNEEKWPAGFQIANGKLIGPRDLFDDPAFDRARSSIKEIASLRAYFIFS
jgi:fructose 1,6-bisphosphate aldolase/phosphatase